jgi:hypothetical protein
VSDWICAGCGAEIPAKPTINGWAGPVPHTGVVLHEGGRFDFCSWEHCERWRERRAKQKKEERDREIEAYRMLVSA